MNRCLVVLAMVLPLLLVTPASAAPNPEKRVQREAKKFNKKLAKDLSGGGNPGNPFICHPADALAAAAALLENRFGVTEIGGGKVVSDQVYAYSSGVSESGEWHRQTRVRYTVTIQGTSEINADVVGVFEERLFEAGKPEPAWRASQANVSGLHADVMWMLRRLELEALRNLELTTDIAGLTQYAAAIAGADGRVTNDAARVFVDWPEMLFEDSNKKGTKKAVWKRTRRLVLSTLPGTTGTRLSADVVDKDCISVDGGAFDCRRAPTQATMMGTHFVNQLALTAAPHRVPPAQTLTAVADGRMEPTGPLSAPPLRTAAQLEAIAEAARLAEEAAARALAEEERARQEADFAAALEKKRSEAIATGVGFFLLTVTGARVAPTQNNGAGWDADWSGLTGLASMAGGAHLGPAGAKVGEEVGKVASEGVASKAAPDVYGWVDLGPGRWIVLPVVPNNHAPTWAASAKLALPAIDSRGQSHEQFIIELFDSDEMSDPEAVGKASFTIREVLAAGGSLDLTVGASTVTLKAELLSP